jgi:hypothetical protein
LQPGREGAHLASALKERLDELTRESKSPVRYGEWVEPCATAMLLRFVEVARGEVNVYVGRLFHSARELVPGELRSESRVAEMLRHLLWPPIDIDRAELGQWAAVYANIKNNAECLSAVKELEWGDFTRDLTVTLRDFDEQRLAAELAIEIMRLAATPCVPVQYVTLDQCAAVVNRSKKTLERLKSRKTNPLPDAEVSGGGGKPDEWLWAIIRPWLEQEFHRPLPQQFPSRR